MSSLASTRIRSEEHVRSLLNLLNATVPQLKAFEVQPALVAEAPDKFNDAGYDDFWFAAQAGRTFWEQSRFFDNASYPHTAERSSYAHDQDVDAAEDLGAGAESKRIADLRTVLRGLQSADWREAVEAAFNARRNLIALIVEFDQPWLFLEQVNDEDGDAFAWDGQGFFHVGIMSRLDQAVERQQVLVFEKVDATNLHRLREGARDYFLPPIRNDEAAHRLCSLLLAAAGIVRDATSATVALRSSGSRSGPHELNLHSHFNRPESYADNLRRGEGDYRIPTDGVWPPYRDPRNGARDGIEMSAEAKAYHTALFNLESGQWREAFAEAVGEELKPGATIALFIDPRDVVLVRDNTAFIVEQGGLELVGAFDYANFVDPAATIAIVRNARGRSD